MKIGVIVGRFQTPYLHAGYLYLIGTALQECEVVLILIGTQKNTDQRNPYTFECRKTLIGRIFKNIYINSLPDAITDEEWSENVDKYINRFGDANEYILYHSRDSFKKSYKGKHRLKELPEIPGFSATEIRKQFIL